MKPPTVSPRLPRQCKGGSRHACSGAAGRRGERVGDSAGRGGLAKLAHHRAQARGVDGLLEEERGMESARLRLEIASHLRHEEDERGGRVEGAEEAGELPSSPDGPSRGSKIQVDDAEIEAAGPYERSRLPHVGGRYHLAS